MTWNFMIINTCNIWNKKIKNEASFVFRPVEGGISITGGAPWEKVRPFGN